MMILVYVHSTIFCPNIQMACQRYFDDASEWKKAKKKKMGDGSVKMNGEQRRMCSKLEYVYWARENESGKATEKLKRRKSLTHRKLWNSRSERNGLCEENLFPTKLFSLTGKEGFSSFWNSWLSLLSWYNNDKMWRHGALRAGCIPVSAMPFYIYAVCSARHSRVGRWFTALRVDLEKILLWQDWSTTWATAKVNSQIYTQQCAQTAMQIQL